MTPQPNPSAKDANNSNKFLNLPTDCHYEILLQANSLQDLSNLLRSYPLSHPVTEEVFYVFRNYFKTIIDKILQRTMGSHHRLYLIAITSLRFGADFDDFDPCPRLRNLKQIWDEERDLMSKSPLQSDGREAVLYSLKRSLFKIPNTLQAVEFMVGIQRNVQFMHDQIPRRYRTWIRWVPLNTMVSFRYGVPVRDAFVGSDEESRAFDGSFRSITACFRILLVAYLLKSSGLEEPTADRHKRRIRIEILLWWRLEGEWNDYPGGTRDLEQVSPGVFGRILRSMNLQPICAGNPCVILPHLPFYEPPQLQNVKAAGNAATSSSQADTSRAGWSVQTNNSRQDATSPRTVEAAVSSASHAEDTTSNRQQNEITEDTSRQDRPYPPFYEPPQLQNVEAARNAANSIFWRDVRYAGSSVRTNNSSQDAISPRTVEANVFLASHGEDATSNHHQNEITEDTSRQDVTSPRSVEANVSSSPHEENRIEDKFDHQQDTATVETSMEANTTRVKVEENASSSFCKKEPEDTTTECQRDTVTGDSLREDVNSAGQNVQENPSSSHKEEADTTFDQQQDAMTVNTLMEHDNSTAQSTEEKASCSSLKREREETPQLEVTIPVYTKKPRLVAPSGHPRRSNRLQERHIGSNLEGTTLTDPALHEESTTRGEASQSVRKNKRGRPPKRTSRNARST